MKTYFSILVLLLMTSVSCNQPTTTAPSPIEKGMVKVTILYPNDSIANFDMDYYANKHMPMLDSLFGETLKKIEIDRGIAGRTPADAVPYLAIGYLYFDTLEAYQEAFAPHAETILGDIPNYTNVMPTVQISEVVQ